MYRIFEFSTETLGIYKDGFFNVSINFNSTRIINSPRIIITFKKDISTTWFYPPVYDWRINWGSYIDLPNDLKLYCERLINNGKLLA